MILFIVLMQVLDVSVYRYESGYTELWYQLPMSVLVDSQELKTVSDSVCTSFHYTFDIRNVDGSDSALVEGNKTVCVYPDDLGDIVIDYLPLSLYPGSFVYDFVVRVQEDSFLEKGNIEIREEIPTLSASDVVLGRTGGKGFLFRGIAMLPSITPEFSVIDRFCSYIELYGLTPDSLEYSVRYTISDRSGEVVQREHRESLKYDYMQVDTHVVDLSRLVPGRYEYTVMIDDPSSGSSAACSTSFAIKAYHDIVEPEFYREIHYLINSNDYKKFLAMSDTQQELYLKEFWSEHDYGQFEQRLAEADGKFSAGDLLGRSSERGRLYIMLGPPDEVEQMTIENWARPFEVWRYYGRNDFLFSDIMNDHNPRLIKVLKPGELTSLLNTGMREGSRDEEWLSDIAPGTYDWHEDKTSPE